MAASQYDYNIWTVRTLTVFIIVVILYWRITVTAAIVCHIAVCGAYYKNYIYCGTVGR